MKEPTIKDLAEEFGKSRQNFYNLKLSESPLYDVYVDAYKYRNILNDSSGWVLFYNGENVTKRLISVKMNNGLVVTFSNAAEDQHIVSAFINEAIAARQKEQTGQQQAQEVIRQALEEPDHS